MRERVLAVLLAVLGLLPATASGDAPPLLSYQGVLTLTGGAVVPDGTYTLSFKVYNDPNAPQTLLYTSADMPVAVQGGLYNVILSGATLEPAFGAPTRFMEVTIKAGPGISTPITLEPRQQIASVPFALVANKARELDPPTASPIPTGAIILWDQSSSCPPGYQEADQFRKLTIRGADVAASDPNFPDGPNVICPGGSGCGAASARYDDRVDVSEMPSHTHSLDATSASYQDPTTSGLSGRVGTFENTGSTGGDKSHFHPFRTVLFCRKL